MSAFSESVHCEERWPCKARRNSLALPRLATTAPIQQFCFPAITREEESQLELPRHRRMKRRSSALLEVRSLSRSSPHLFRYEFARGRCCATNTLPFRLRFETRAYRPA